MEPMLWRTSRRRLLAAAAAAVAIHLLLALCVSLWPERPPQAPPRPSPPIAIVLQQRSGGPVPDAGGAAPRRGPAADSPQEAAVPHVPRTRSAPTTRLAEGAENEK